MLLFCVFGYSLCVEVDVVVFVVVVIAVVALSL